MRQKATEINNVRLKELRLYGFFSFAFWPCIVIMALFATSFSLIKGIFTMSRRKISEAFKYLSWIILPYYLIKLALKEKNSTMILTIILLFPFMLATLVGPLFLLLPDNIEYGAPKPPLFYRLFSDSGEGLFGTTGEGVEIERLIFTGAGYIYFTSLIAVVFVLVTGLWLGKLTFYKRAEFNIMGFVEIVETIPLLFLLLVVLAIFGWWEDGWKGLGSKGQILWNVILTIVVGVSIGFGFLPRIIRLIRERVKTFVSENFVDGLKAHGIDQNRILWYHIIKKNCMGDIIIAITQTWAAVILIGISLDYLISIFPLFGAKIYNGWAQMLLTPEAKKAVLFLKDLRLKEWWLYSFPIFFIVTTITGFYLFGDSLRSIYDKNKNFIMEEDNRATKFDYTVQNLATKMGI